MQISFDACNKIQLGDAVFLNNLIRETGTQSQSLHLCVKPIYTLKPESLEMNCTLMPPIWPFNYELGKKKQKKCLRGEDTEKTGKRNMERKKRSCLNESETP